MSKSGSQTISDQKLVENSHKVACETSSAVLSVPDIRNPTSATTNKFYQQYLADLGMEIALITDLPAYQSMQHPEIHRTMLQQGLVTKAMQYFMENINSPYTFTITDLISPSPVRHKHFLNELIQCHLFANKAQCHVETTVNRLRDREEKIQMLREDYDRLKNQRAELLLERGLREEKIKNFDKRMATTSEQTKKLTCEMSDQRQRLNELQQEFDESKQKREQLIQSKELLMNKLKQLESQLVNSPMRFKNDLSIAAASLKTLTEEVASREAILNKRQVMEKGLSTYISVLKQVKEMAQQVGDLKKKISRCNDNNNELMIEKQKLATAHEKLLKEKLAATDRLQKLQQMSLSANQTQDRKLAEMGKTLKNLKDEQQRLIDLLDTTDQATKQYNIDKEDLDLELKKNADFEAGAVDLMNFIFKTEVEGNRVEAELIIQHKFEQLKMDFEAS